MAVILGRKGGGSGGGGGGAPSGPAGGDLSGTYPNPSVAAAYTAARVSQSIADAKGDLIAATAADTFAKLTVGANGKVLVADSAQTAGLKYDFPPGYEFGYDEVTTSVTVSSTTESSGTTVISCAAHTFDGQPVIAEFFCPGSGTNASDTTVSLFEGATQISRIAYSANTTGIVYEPIVGKLRFTPTAGSHTYTVTAFRGTADNALLAGAKGTGAWPPMYIRFIKV
jgi:hypothetical protein